MAAPKKKRSFSKRKSYKLRYLHNLTICPICNKSKQRHYICCVKKN